MVTNLVAMVTNLVSMVTKLIAMVTNLIVMVTNLVSMVTNLVSMVTNLVTIVPNLDYANGVVGESRQPFLERVYMINFRQFHSNKNGVFHENIFITLTEIP